MAKIGIDISSGKINKSTTVIGIDLGTTNSLIATVDEKSRVPYCLSIDSESIVPSVVFFEKDIPVAGREAWEQMKNKPAQTVYSIKRLMGKSYSDIEQNLSFFNYPIVDTGSENLVKVSVNNKYYTPIEISAIILKKLKSLAEQKLNAEVSKVVITVPAYFNDTQRQATRDAGKLAGLDVLRVVNEPTAASLAYGLGLQPQDERKVAIYDLGGGTFDISLLNIQQGIFEVVATNGDTFLGGDDIDQIIVKYWLNKLNIQEIVLSDVDSQVIRLAAEKAKIVLSSQDTCEQNLSLGGTDYSLTLHRAEFDKLITSLVEKTIVSCESALRDANWKAADIANLVFVGGSTRIPLVQKIVQEYFQLAQVNNEINPDEVVALGAAVEADILAGNRRDVLLLDVTPLSLGIETLGGVMDVIIPRNSKIPNKVKRQYTTSKDGQVNLKIGVYQGERDLIKDNRKLGEFELRGIPAMPAGLPKIEVTFTLNADGILSVSALEIRSGLSQEITLKPQFGLDDKEIEQILKSSIVHAEEDMKQRALTEAVVEAEQLMYSLNKFISQHSSLITSSDLELIATKMEELKNELDTKNKEIIVSLTEGLNDFTRKYAEIAMNQEIGKALKGKSI